MINNFLIYKISQQNKIQIKLTNNTLICIQIILKIFKNNKKKKKKKNNKKITPICMINIIMEHSIKITVNNNLI